VANAILAGVVGLVAVGLILLGMAMATRGRSGTGSVRAPKAEKRPAGVS
jgi:hypothetical protein